MSVSGIEADGYAPVRSADDNGPGAVTQLRGRALSTQLADHYAFVVERKGKGGKVFYTEEWFLAGDCDRVLDIPDAIPYLRLCAASRTRRWCARTAACSTGRATTTTAGTSIYPTGPIPTVPERPTAEQLDAAVTMLRAIVAEFAWAGKHDEANFLGMLLTPLLRELCPPPYKLGAIMARQPGSGNSLLNQILRDVHGGVFRGGMLHDDAELEKSISSILTCTTAPVVQFDNVSGTLRSSRLAALLTSREYSGRILGSTNGVDMVNDRLWTLTGNNVNLGGDLVRRTLWCTIDPGCPDPQLRTGFKLDTPAYVAQSTAAPASTPSRSPSALDRTGTGRGCTATLVAT
ncbi:MAG: hypothetical protein LH603_09675 [Pseudonocardia sp.]|nr:hypothetical protein [Pseudonocardia sp.]